MKTDQNKDPKDGFDLIEYPCDYAFKAMCRVDKCSEQSVKSEIVKLVLDHVDESLVLNAQSKFSRTAKFESVTLTVRISDRKQLEVIYQALAASPLVVMTL